MCRAHASWRSTSTRGRQRVAIACIVACALGARAALAQTSTTPLTLEAAIARALDANPSLIAARLRRNVDISGIAVARDRPNPEFRIELERETPTNAYTFAAPLETGGKRTHRIAVGEAVLRTGEAEVRRTEIEVRTLVRRAYATRVGAQARLVLLQDLRELAGRARDAARLRFDAGGAPRLEVLQAELAVAQADNEVASGQAAEAGARGALNVLLGFEVAALTPLASDAPPPLVPASDLAVSRALSSSAELAALDARIEEQRARAALARAMQWPDVTPEFAITHGAEPEFSTGWRAAVGLTLPLFTQHRASVYVEDAALAQVVAERHASAARLAGDVASAAVLADAQLQQLMRYRDQILPQALEVERMAEDSYRLGQTGIGALLQALQATRDARLRSLQTSVDLQIALADLERAMGAPLP